MPIAVSRRSACINGTIVYNLVTFEHPNRPRVEINSQLAAGISRICFHDPETSADRTHNL